MTCFFKILRRRTLKIRVPLSQPYALYTIPRGIRVALGFSLTTKIFVGRTASSQHHCGFSIASLCTSVFRNFININFRYPQQ